MDNKVLIDYIKNCYELEKSIYLQTEVVNYYIEKQLYYEDYKKFLRPTYKQRTCLPMGSSSLEDVIKEGKYAPVYGREYGGDSLHELPYSPDEIAIYIDATKNLKFNFMHSKSYRFQKTLEAHNVALAEKNNEILLYNEGIKKDVLEKSELIGVELDNETQRLKQTKQVLDEFYLKDIIFVKYRSLVAISAILEYLMSGRCISLPEAYNKYEEELRQQIIIDKLDVIIDKLEIIENNQYMLYDAIMSVNKNLGEITQGMENVLSSMSAIQDNAAISAHNSKIIADNEVYQSKLLTFDVTYRALLD